MSATVPCGGRLEWLSIRGEPVKLATGMFVWACPACGGSGRALAPREVCNQMVAAPAVYRPQEPARRWTFRVAGIPRTKRGADVGRSGKGGAGRHMHSDDTTTAYELKVAGAASEAGMMAGSGPCEVKIELVLPNRRRKDADRVTTAIFDGLKRAGKAALADDNLCVIQRTIIELTAVDELAPCAVITVTMLDRDRSR